MIAENQMWSCQQILTAFFDKFPDRQLQVEANSMLRMLAKLDFPMPGKPGGWAGGIIYAAATSIVRLAAYQVFSIGSVRSFWCFDGDNL